LPYCNVERLVPVPRREDEPRQRSTVDMKRFLVMMVAMAVMGLAMISPVWAADVQGKIKSVDPTGRMVTLEDGTQLMIPPTLRIAREDLKPGADVKASYEDMGKQKVVTAIQVQPAE
jgi:uncharacterized protein DUF1344